jgi:hypothetical protein
LILFKPILILDKFILSIASALNSYSISGFIFTYDFIK